MEYSDDIEDGSAVRMRRVMSYTAPDIFGVESEQAEARREAEAEVMKLTMIANGVQIPTVKSFAIFTLKNDLRSPSLVLESILAALGLAMRQSIMTELSETEEDEHSLPSDGGYGSLVRMVASRETPSMAFLNILVPGQGTFSSDVTRHTIDGLADVVDQWFEEEQGSVDVIYVVLSRPRHQLHSQQQQLEEILFDLASERVRVSKGDKNTCIVISGFELLVAANYSALSH